MAKRGFQETANLDPILHYKFFLLKAGFASCESPQKALTMLDAVSPDLIKHGDLEAERKYIQARASGCAKNYGKAEELLSISANLAKRYNPSLTPNIAFAAAWLKEEELNERQAEAYYINAIAVARQSNNPIEASALNNFARIRLKTWHFREASENFLSSIAIARKWHDQLIEEIALGNLGYVYSELGDFPNAEDYSKQAADIAERINEPDDEKTWLITLGRSYQSDARQRFTEAEAAYAQAVTIAHTLHDNEGAAKCFSNLAQLALKRSDISKAEDYTNQAAELHPTGELALYLILDKADIAQAKKDYGTAEHLLLTAIQASPSPPVLLLWRLEADLANNYAAQGQNNLADKWFNIALKTTEDAFARVVPRVPDPNNPQMTFLDSAPFWSAYISFLIEHNKPVDALAVADLGRARILAEAAGKRTRAKTLADIKRVQAHLSPGKEVVLAYFLGDDKSYLWVITHAEIKFFSLPAIKEIYEKIHAYNKEIQDLEKLGDSSNGRALYEMLIRPAEGLVPKNALVTIVPNRYLYYLDFDTLVVPGSHPHYWIEDANIQVCSALTLLANSHPENTPSAKQMLLIGAPIQAKGGPGELQHAKEEVDRIASHFPHDQELVFRADQAIPEAYLDHEPGHFRFIHFATHGIASLEKPLESAIILSPDSNGQYKLDAPAIIKMKIHADLVTISSCESAGTRTYDAEGLVGLGWAFMRAGAHKVVAGLWDVDDASTPALMDEFYTELGKGIPPANALRLAKLAILHSNDHRMRPYYWAPLQLYVGS
ncbi:MAG TPA: CHAT domain-containing tetratricopeptide repeat protein [Candidatus Angelobacter sp.]|nr:CHAT domain-containing tetratricopeptide repeat protein [Candidatus Angelobacter sp.]